MLATDYTTAEEWALIAGAKALLEKAGAVYTIWTADDLANEAEDAFGDLTQPELDNIVNAAWPVGGLDDCTNSDWELIRGAIDEAVASGAHKTAVAA